MFFIAPTASQARQILWDIIKDKARNVTKKTHESTLMLELINGTKIFLKSGDAPERLRGVSLDFCIFDEAASFRNLKDIWNKIVRPSLADKLGGAMFISSPNSRNDFYDLWSACDTKDDWSSFQFTTAQGMNVSLEEIQNAKADLDEKSFNQEFNSTFENFQGLVVPKYCPIQNNSNEEILPTDKLHIGVDHNITKNPAAVFIIRNGALHLVDAFYGSFDTTDLMESITQRYPKHQIIFYPDPSGNQRSASSGNITNHSIIRSYGYPIKTLIKHAGIIDRVNAFNSLVCSASGVRKVFFKKTKNTEKFIETLEKHVFDDNGLPSKSHEYFDDIFDSQSYLTWFFSSYGNSKPVQNTRR